VTRWRWLVVALAALAVTCFVPGSMLTRAMAGERLASIEAVSASSAPSGCAVASCNRGSAFASGGVPTIALAGTLAIGCSAVPSVRRARRRHARAMVLATGVLQTLLHPPQVAPSM